MSKEGVVTYGNFGDMTGCTKVPTRDRRWQLVGTIGPTGNTGEVFFDQKTLSRNAGLVAVWILVERVNPARETKERFEIACNSGKIATFGAVTGDGVSVSKKTPFDFPVPESLGELLVNVFCKNGQKK